MTVDLIDLTTKYRLRLDAKRARWLVDELRHEKRVRPRARGIEPGTDATLLIVVTEKGRRRKYELFDRTVVLEESSGRSWQFYFGMVATEWLQWAQHPPASYQPVIQVI